MLFQVIISINIYIGIKKKDKKNGGVTTTTDTAETVFKFF